MSHKVYSALSRYLEFGNKCNSIRTSRRVPKSLLFCKFKSYTYKGVVNLVCNLSAKMGIANGSFYYSFFLFQQ